MRELPSLVVVFTLSGCAGCGDTTGGASAVDGFSDSAGLDTSELKADAVVIKDAGAEDDDAAEAGCSTGYHLCGGSCVSDDSPTTCGTRCNPCPIPPAPKIALCTADRKCDVACGPGYDAVGSDCSLLPAQPISPLSASIVTSRKPTLTWKNLGSVTKARVEVCADVACKKLLGAANVTGSNWAPTTELPVGMIFWRVFAYDAKGISTTASPTWELSVPGTRSSSPNETSWGSVADYGRLGFGGAVVGQDMDSVTAGEAPLLDFMQGPSLEFAFQAGDGESEPVLPAIGDLNGDGFVDLAAGVIGAYPTGRIDVYLDPSSHSIPGLFWWGKSATFAETLAFGGDVNRDGYGDLIVGDPQGGEGGQGEVSLLPGGSKGVSKTPLSMLDPPASESTSVGTHLNFGDRLAGTGDLDGDGYGDLAVHDQYFPVGAPGPLGHVFIYFGGPSGFTAAPIALPPPHADANFGNALHVAGDVNGDGLADLLVGDSDVGSGDHFVYIYFGSKAAPFPTTPAVSIRVPSAIAVPIGDINADGYSDIAIGAADLTIYAGGPSGPSLSTILGTLPGPLRSIGGIGDVDADGYFDFGVINGARFSGYRGGATFPTSAAWSFCNPSSGTCDQLVPFAFLGGLD